MIVVNAFFWGGIALMPECYLTYFTSWAMGLSVLSFTLSVAAHIKESCKYRRKHSNISGLDSSIGDDSTFLAFNPGAMNPYSPSAGNDLELFRLQSKHLTLWKYVIVIYELALPA